MDCWVEKHLMNTGRKMFWGTQTCGLLKAFSFFQVLLSPFPVHTLPVSPSLLSSLVCQMRRHGRRTVPSTTAMTTAAHSRTENGRSGRREGGCTWYPSSACSSWSARSWVGIRRHPYSCKTYFFPTEAWLPLPCVPPGGYFAGSLAVMTDAAHLMVDFTSFLISLCSLWLSSRPPTQALSFGWHRAGKTTCQYANSGSNF